MDDKIRKVHEEERLGIRKYKGSKYYDYPDGEDLVGKLSYTTKVTAAAMSLFGIMNASMRPSPTTFKGKFLRYCQIVVPAVGMAATFTIVTYYSTNIRKKDDELNYILGGAAAGFLLGPVTGIVASGPIGALCGAFVGYSKKSAQMKGQKMLPDTKGSFYPSYYLRKIDTSFFPEKKGNWTREPEVK